MSRSPSDATKPRQLNGLFGPGLLVTAAFVGPGTVVTATKSGAAAGSQLLWAVLFATVGAIVLQNLSARLAVLSGKGLASSIRSAFAESVWFRWIVALVLIAIGIGNAAYQAGNLTGAAAGLTMIIGLAKLEVQFVLVLVTGCIAAALIAFGSFTRLKQILAGLVALLSIGFVYTALASQPNWSEVITNCFKPQTGNADLTLVIALIGTTIVPYNLFLHSSATASALGNAPLDGQLKAKALRLSMLDTILSIALGGLVTASILLASAAVFEGRQEFSDIQQFGKQLEPTLGGFSNLAFGLGLFAAGLTSSLTAPLATSFAACEILGWNRSENTAHFKGIALFVVAAGTAAVLILGGSPSELILLAQMANGLLLPVVAFFLIIVVRRHQSRSWQSNVGLGFAWAVVLAIATLGIYKAATGFYKVALSIYSDLSSFLNH